MQNVDDIFNNTVDEHESFNQIHTPAPFEGTGTMRMSVLEDVQEAEEKIQ